MLGELDPLAPGDGVAAAGARRAYWLTVLMGSGTLAPWNAWLLAYNYFDTVFGQKRDVQYVFTACYFGPAALVVLLMLRPSQVMRRLSTRARIVLSYSINVVLLVVVPLFVVAGTFSWDPRGGTPDDAWVPMIVVVTVSGLSTGILYASIFSYITMLPQHYTQACMSGLAASGAGLALVRILAKLTLGGDSETSHDHEKDAKASLAQHAEVVVFFGLAAATSLACIVAFGLLRKSDVVKHYDTRRTAGRGARHSLQAHILAESDGTSSWGAGTSFGRTSMVMNATTSDRVILTSIKTYAFAVLWNFAVTTVIFPGLATAQFHTGERKGFINPSWYEVTLIATFLLLDFAGRQVPALGPRATVSKNAVVGLVLLRTLFIPLYAAVAYSSPEKPNFLHGVCEFSVMALFAFSHGYCSTVCMMGAPAAAGSSSSSDEPERQRAATIMSALTNVGIIVGALLAFLWLLFPFDTSNPTGHGSHAL
jgi:hypothetical protein